MLSFSTINIYSNGVNSM